MRHLKPRGPLMAYPANADHAYDNPTLDSLGFLRAVMHDHSLDVSVRLEAAFRLAPYECAPPRPVPQPVEYTINIQFNDQAPTDLHFIPFCYLFEDRPNPFKVVDPLAVVAEGPDHSASVVDGGPRTRTTEIHSEKTELANTPISQSVKSNSALN